VVPGGADGEGVGGADGEGRGVGDEGDGEGGDRGPPGGAGEAEGRESVKGEEASVRGKCHSRFQR
jgi:hypothetical protein